MLGPLDYHRCSEVVPGILLYQGSLYRCSIVFTKMLSLSMNKTYKLLRVTCINIL